MGNPCPILDCFHIKCIDPWFEQKDTCPECRHCIGCNEVDDDVKAEVNEGVDEMDGVDEEEVEVEMGSDSSNNFNDVIDLFNI